MSFPYSLAPFQRKPALWVNQNLRFRRGPTARWSCTVLNIQGWPQIFMRNYCDQSLSLPSSAINGVLLSKRDSVKAGARSILKFWENWMFAKIEQFIAIEMNLNVCSEQFMTAFPSSTWAMAWLLWWRSRWLRWEACSLLTHLVNTFLKIL